MSHTTTYVAHGFTEPRNSGATIEVLRDQAALESLAADEAYQLASTRGGSLPTIDWTTEVVVIAELPDGSGFDVRPEIRGIRRRGDTVEVTLGQQMLPDASFLDVVSRAWLVVRAPAEAFGSDAGVEIVLDLGSVHDAPSPDDRG